MNGETCELGHDDCTWDETQSELHAADEAEFHYAGAAQLATVEREAELIAALAQAQKRIEELEAAAKRYNVKEREARIEELEAAILQYSPKESIRVGANGEKVCVELIMSGSVTPWRFIIGTRSLAHPTSLRPSGPEHMWEEMTEYYDDDSSARTLKFFFHCAKNWAENSRRYVAIKNALNEKA